MSIDTDEYAATLAAFDRAARPSPPTSFSGSDRMTLADAARGLAEVDQDLEVLKARRKQLLNTIKAIVDPPEDRGWTVEFQDPDLTDDTIEIECDRGEPSLKWDSDQLLKLVWAALAAGEPLPNGIEVSATVPKKVFEKLSADDIARVAHALTTEPGKLRIRARVITAAELAKEKT